MASTIIFGAKPNLDKKWLRANLTSALRSTNDLANLWNHLLEDGEVVESENKLASNFSFIDESVDRLDSNASNVVTSETIFNSWIWNPIPSKLIDRPACGVPVKRFLLLFVFAANEEKQDCVKALLMEQQNLCHQAAENCLSVMGLKRVLYVYNRYFIALSRYKPDVEECRAIAEHHPVAVDTKVHVSLKVLPRIYANLPN